MKDQGRTQHYPFLQDCRPDNQQWELLFLLIFFVNSIPTNVLRCRFQSPDELPCSTLGCCLRLPNSSPSWTQTTIRTYFRRLRGTDETSCSTLGCCLRLSSASVGPNRLSVNHLTNDLQRSSYPGLPVTSFFSKIFGQGGG